MLHPLFNPYKSVFIFALLCWGSALYAAESELTAPIEIQQNLEANDAPEVQVAVADIPLYFSPYALSPLNEQYTHLFFDPLVRWSATRELEKRLVSEWQLLKPGVIRFHLKNGIIFHSGNQLSSDDVIWTFSQIRKDVNANAFFSKIRNIKKVDELRFDIYADLSETQLLDYLSHFFVLDQAFYQLHKINVNSKQEVVEFGGKQLPISGTGPYKISQYNPLLHLRVATNNRYWGGTNSISGFNFIKIRSADSRLYALLANDVDISEAIAKKDIVTVSSAPFKKLVEVNSSEVVFFTINDKRSDVFKRRIARDAVALSINKVGMLKHIVNNLGSVRDSFTPRYDIDNKFSEDVLEYDARSARTVFSKISMPEELKLLVLVDKIGNTPQVANALLNMMQRVGIKLVITEVSDLEKWNDLFADHDFSLFTWQSPLLDSDNIYQQLFTDSPLRQYMNELFDEGSNDGTLATKISLFQQSQQSQRIMPLLFLNKIWACDEKYNLAPIFSINSIPYWHLLVVNK